ncbi:MAG: translation elongation factor Ts [Nitrospinaceae bacterium]
MEITAGMVKELRGKSGAGILECKNALQDANGDLEEAMVTLRKKGIAKAEKKGGRAAGDGSVGAYIHAGNKIGVLLKLHCETDFVANTQEFQDLIKDISMHIAAAKPRFTSREEVTGATLAQEREIYAHQARESGKPEKIIEKIVTGKMEKFYAENCLLEQPFIKDTDKTIQDIIKEAIAKLGENITVGEFARMEI